jgi:hypothetical protein
MKRFTLLISAVVVLTAAVYAEDAAVLPAKTLRLNTDASTGFVREGWDGNGKRVDAPDAVIIGAAIRVSYGFTDWFTTVLGWSPGVTDTDIARIDIGSDGNSAEEIYEGLGDFTLKGQFQIIGNDAAVSSERFRMRVTPGIVIPFPGIDDRDVLGNHAWGVGGDVSLDTFIAGNFLLNLFGEAYWFPIDNRSKTNNQWQFSLEAGPRYAVTIGTASLALALPVNWGVSQAHDKTIPADGISSYLLSLRPTLELNLTRPLRINIAIEYTCPLYGKSNYIAHTIKIKTPVNFDFANNKEVEALTGPGETGRIVGRGQTLLDRGGAKP